jgi:hypothetical protein
LSSAKKENSVGPGTNCGETQITSDTVAKVPIVILPPKLHLKTELGENPEPCTVMGIPPCTGDLLGINAEMEPQCSTLKITPG